MVAQHKQIISIIFKSQFLLSSVYGDHLKGSPKESTLFLTDEVVLEQSVTRGSTGLVGQNTSCKPHKVCISLWPMGWDDVRTRADESPF